MHLIYVAHQPCGGISVTVTKAGLYTYPKTSLYSINRLPGISQANCFSDYICRTGGIMKFNVIALTLTAGLIWGAAILIVASANLIWPDYGRVFLDVVARFSLEGLPEEYHAIEPK